MNTHDTFIKELQGFSGSKVLLIKSLNDFIIRKIDNIERNYEKLVLLKNHNFLVPEIIDKDKNVLDMEYIHGQDMKNFFKLEDIKKFTKFVIDTMIRFKSIGEKLKDYTPVYSSQLSFFDGDTSLPFNTNDLLEKLPKFIPTSLCHGDFTLDNIIYKEDSNFYMIDPVTGVYDSWVFDIAKMRQDIEGKWFLRNSSNMSEYDLELSYIKKELMNVFPECFNDYLYILMLLRVYKYSQKGTKEQKMLLEEIKRVWK